MKKPIFQDNLPCAPSLSLSEEFTRIRSAVLQQSLASGNVMADERWERVAEEYQKWENSFAGRHTSLLNRKLHLYQMLLLTLPEIALQDHSELIDVVLSTIPKLGEIIDVPFANGTNVSAEVIRREITDRLGVLITLKKPGGEMFSQEFFD